MLLLACILSLYQVRSQSPDEAYMRGSASLAKGDFADAVENLSMAIRRDNSDEQIFINRGVSYLKLREFNNAIRDFDEANQILPGVAELWIARAYALRGDADSALLHLALHLKSELRIDADSISRDKSFTNIQNTAAWDALWQQDWYSADEKAIAEARYYTFRKQYDEALASIQNEFVADPGSSSLLTARAGIFAEQGNYAAAIADYSSVLRLDKFNMEVIAGRGLAYLKAGRFKDAVADFTRALKDDPARFGLYLSRAEAYAGLELWDEAIGDVSLYLEYFENDQEAIYVCGEYCFQSGDYISALKYFNRNLKEDPDKALYYKARGKTYIKTATYRFAFSDLAMSLDLDPSDAETWMYMGIVKHQTGDRVGGCSDLEKSRQLGNTEVLRYIADYCGK